MQGLGLSRGPTDIFCLFYNIDLKFISNFRSYSKMAGQNLPNSISDSFGIPHDVKFLFTNEDNGGSTEVLAHKFVLSLASDVFKREFYGSMKESGEGIKIVDASQEVFSVMVEFIYDKKLDWASFSLSLLASLYYLAEKYNIKDLMEKILIKIQGFKFVKDM